MIGTAFSVLIRMEVDTNSTSFTTTIYNHLVNWMGGYDSRRCASNTNVDLLDSVSPEGISMYSFFTTFNLIVYIVFTVLLYYVFFKFTLFFISYFSNNITSGLNKVAKLYSGQSEANHKVLEFNKSLVSILIFINKVVVIGLFIILLVLSMYLYTNYSISTFFSSHFMEAMKYKYNPEAVDVHMKMTLLELPVHYFQKAAQVLIGILFGLYRTFVLVRALDWPKFYKSVLGLAIIIYFQDINEYIFELVLVDDATTHDIPFAKMCEACNTCVKLLFYSLLIVLVSGILQKILSFFKNSFINPDINQPNVQEKQYYIITIKSLIYNILVVFLKTNTSLGYIGVFHSMLYLFTHSIPLG